jgi:hypothetical protein
MKSVKRQPMLDETGLFLNSQFRPYLPPYLPHPPHPPHLLHDN